MKILLATLLCLSALQAAAAERAIAKEVVVNATLDQAWAAWTTREGIVSFFAPDAEIWGDGGEWDRTYAYFDRAWGGVLGNMKKRFEQGPQDWTAWLKQLEESRAKPR